MLLLLSSSVSSIAGGESASIVYAVAVVAMFGRGAGGGEGAFPISSAEERYYSLVGCVQCCTLVNSSGCSWGFDFFRIDRS